MSGLTPAGVVLAWLFPRDVSGWFCHSIADLMRWDAQGPGHVCGPKGGFICLSSGPRVAEARNQIVDKFAEEYPDTEWLLMLDSDMTFEADIVEKMLAVANPETVPILGALAFAAAGDHFGAFPTIYKEVEVNGSIFVDRVEEYPRDALVKVGATGGAGLLIHRNVLATMSQPWPKGFGTREDGTPNPYPWFSEGLVNKDGKPLGEDIAFCRRASMLGIPVHVDTRIKMGHMKTYELNEDYYQARVDEEKAQTGTRAQRRQAARAAARRKVSA